MERGLRSQQQEAERVARELMDVKIEAAHLRERLRQRVGGDTTAVELEAEAFALQTALSETQETLKTRETALQTLENKYEKAMRGMMKLDEAWSDSKKQTMVAEEARRIAEQQVNDEKRRGDELLRQLEVVTGREMTLRDRVDVLIQEKKEMERMRDDERLERKEREMELYELRAQLETMRQHFEIQMKEQEGATRQDVRHFQELLQQTQEEAAAVRGEISARQKEAAKVETELRDTKAMEATTKQRLVKLTEDHATLRVHLESAKMVAVESTQRAIQAETENENMRKELEERDNVLMMKEQSLRALEGELLQMQKTMEEALSKKKQAVEETQQRLVMESQEMLQAQEETWSCREKMLQQEVENYKQEMSRVQTFHVELAQLLQTKDGDVTTAEQETQSVKPAMLQALVVQEVNKRDILLSALEKMRIQLGTIKRQLGSQKQLETENLKLRAEYEKAKLAMERMATRKAKSFASLTSLPVRQAGNDSGGSSSSEKSASKEGRPGTMEITPIVKRELEAGETNAIELRTTPRKAQRIKHVYVASRYLSSASKR
ncbi:unnamed protein product [Peronospora farinosa]|uniref:Cilia- and flagella-associated protein 157 n=1 Tax=Peronospora farinosa TaxID=134698 RepID=A0AAV0UG23_9STRA|nr:unnamed protein product [Peronospora farinosa]CAI5735932.1 unnamed protein product [Peronospora farinosa]